MTLEAISGAATVALACTTIYLLIAKTWSMFSRTMTSTPAFSDRIMHEAAQRFRDEFERLGRSQSVYLGGSLAFLVLFGMAYALEARQLFAGYPAWQLYLQTGFLLLVAAFAFMRLCKVIVARRQVRFVRDANVAIGHQLQQLGSGFARVFHDVTTSAGTIDHLLVGQSGIYAVNVIAARGGKRHESRLIDSAVQFSNNAPAVSILDINTKNARLQKEFSKLLGHGIRVRSVVAVPGWDIGSQHSESHLLVNERTLSMLSGWKDNSDYLMNEDVELLQQELATRCASR